MDSDDTIAPESLQVLREAVERTHAEICSFNLRTHDGQGSGETVEISRQYDAPFTLAEHPEFLLSLPAAWARIWKRELFLRTGIRYPSRVWYEDIRTSTKLFAVADSIVTLPQTLYYYLARPGSIMRSSNVGRNREILEAFDDVLAWFRAQGLFETYRQELCRLAVDHILIAATVRVARMDPHSALLGEFSGFVDANFPDYRRNPYLKQLPRKHKLVLRLAEGKHFSLLRLLFRLKDGD